MPTRLKMMPSNKSSKMLKNSSTKKMVGVHRVSSNGPKPANILRTGKGTLHSLKLAGSPVAKIETFKAPETQKYATTKNIKFKIQPNNTNFI